MNYKILYSILLINFCNSSSFSLEQIDYMKKISDDYAMCEASIVDESKVIVVTQDNYQDTSLTLNEIQHILTAQLAHKNSTLIESIATKKNAHEKLNAIAAWFQEGKNEEFWLDYFAIHNQMLIAIQKELESLKNFSEIYNEMSQKFITILDLAIKDLYENNEKPEAMISLLYIREDYINLFERIGKND